jgi:hypothetical protein
MPVAVIALLWNLMGCYAYLSNVTMSPEAIARLPQAQQAMFNSFPVWGVVGMALAVWFGALGSLALIMRKGWAVPLFTVSLVGLVVQDIAMFGVAGGASSGGFAMQGLVLLVAIALLMLARKARAAGWVSGPLGRVATSG